MVKIIVPIIDSSLFEMYKIILVPSSIGKGLVRVLDEEHEYLASNMRSRHFMLLNHEEVDGCKKIVTFSEIKRVLCRVSKPLVNGKDGGCVLSLFLNAVPNDCVYKISKSKETLVNLNGGNEWLYTVKERGTIRVVCEKSSSDVLLEENSVIKIKQGCDMHMGESVFKSRNIVDRNLSMVIPNAYVLPKLNLTDLLLGHASKVLPEVDKMQIVSGKDHNLYLKESAREIDELVSDFEDVQRRKRQDVHQVSHAAVTGSILLVILILILLALCLVRKFGNRLNALGRRRPSIHREQVRMNEVGILLNRTNSKRECQDKWEKAAPQGTDALIDRKSESEYETPYPAVSHDRRCFNIVG